MRLIDDLPTFKKKWGNQEKRRLQRLREAKQNGEIKRMVVNLATKELQTKILSDKQRMAIYFMTDFVHNFKYKWIAARVGVDLKTINTWRNDPLFMRELDKQIDRRTSYMRGHAWRNVFRRIALGDVKVSLEYLKGIGDLTSKVDMRVDDSGEKEKDDAQLEAEILALQGALVKANKPSDN